MGVLGKATGSTMIAAPARHVSVSTTAPERLGPSVRSKVRGRGAGPRAVRSTQSRDRLQRGRLFSMASIKSSQAGGFGIEAAADP